MTIQDLLDEWDSLSFSRKRLALLELTSFLSLRVGEEFDDEAYRAIFESMVDFEQDDYFGTEGADF